ncbi:PAS domain S-box protein [Mucilaginibacter sp. KACC 22063]|uniref:PAS domain S-box protein n=1 Tax=Mucilaginibacter sp. KACC 22063 TaxID=3025666 RepID=UPI0023664F0D|nr:PAS domain S-box protein [Mucilaginibacter sp. KACC 22063]WDF56746.1 PAS domain S-box protein [Mucilaginibacter sp. KACC 22063]
MTDHEKNRLEAVARFMELDGDINKDLNDLVNLAAQICETPIALITLIDEDMQWFKASTGVDIYCNTREASLCKHTIEQDDLLMIEDARVDPRLADHPFVTGEPYVKFYAGVNLITRDGYKAGTICVIGTELKVLTNEQKNALILLGKQVMNLMELNWSLNTLDNKHAETLRQKDVIENSELQLKAVFDSSKELFILLGKNFELLSFNKAAEENILKVTGQYLVAGVSFAAYLESELIKKIQRYYKAAISGRAVKSEFLILETQHADMWMEISFTPVKNAGEIIGVALNGSDISARKRHEERIHQQNEALQRIAIIQSHELRRPVASLLGMIGLIKLEQDKPDEAISYFNMIETTVQELDDKIRGIVYDSETVLNHNMHGQ